MFFLLTVNFVFLLTLASGECRLALDACVYLPAFEQDGMYEIFCRDYVPKITSLVKIKQLASCLSYLSSLTMT